MKKLLKAVLRRAGFELRRAPTGIGPSGVEIETAIERNGSVIYDCIIASRYVATWQKHLSRTPERILQMGAGPTLGVESALCAAGVSEAWAHEPFAPLQFDIADFARGYNAIGKARDAFGTPNGASRRQALEWQQVAPEHFRVADGEVRRFTRGTFEASCFDDEHFDFLFSHACLEHVQNPRACAREAFRLLRSGGVTAHQIDLRDHRDFNDPLRFLHDEPREWAWDGAFQGRYNRSSDGAVFTNRLRALGWREAFESAGLEVVEFDVNMTVPLETIQCQRTTLHTDFQGFSDDDLAALGLFLVARKP